jgi:hypothetical protein
VTAVTAPLEGGSTERDVARDLVRRALPLTPLVVLAAAIPWGVDGALSALFALVLVCANFLLSAGLITSAARISLPLLMAAVLGGYLVRLALLFGAVLLVKDLGWVELWPLGLTLVVAHLGLLLWETRHVSASLAFPGLKPKA